MKHVQRDYYSTDNVLMLKTLLNEGTNKMKRKGNISA
jgi:hypothetical protein